jgi:hypothetical protein
MATIAVIEAKPPYYAVRVEFDTQVFQQTIVSSQTGAALDAQLQAYADDYEAQWLALEPVPQEA